MDSKLLLVASLAVLLPVLYMYTAAVVHTRFPALHNKRICLLIAHPDDEAMFFSPTVQALTRPETGNHVKILCLSTGDADGLGEVRRKELVKSGLTLGLRDEEDVMVLNRPNDFPDSMTATWDEGKISSLLSEAFGPSVPKQKRRNDSDQPTANIDVIITFDKGGVSSHPNHISLYHGARAFMASLMKGKDGWESPVDLYTLRSVNVLRKYSSFLDIFATMVSWVGVRHKSRAHPGGLVFLSQLVGQGGFPTAWSAMTTAHKSQMVWFRYLWISFSRYMVINDLKLEKVRAK